MIIVRENLVELLNMDLELETTGILRCISHAAMLTGNACGNIINALRVYTHEKIEHAMALADQIKYLGGLPSVKVGNICTSDDNKEILMSDFDEAEDAIQRYKIRIEQAEQLKEMELSKRLRIILRVEQQHAMYLQNLFCARAMEGDDSNLTRIDPCDLSEKWAEKAANVPIRIKKYK